jgi:SEC-C motif-containing protein
MMPGRNDPCPCGSGKKYKRCCLGKAGETAEADVGQTTHSDKMSEGFDFEGFGRLGVGPSFSYFKIMSEALAKDTRRCMNVCLELKAKLPEGQPIDSPTYIELSFWYRNLLRAFVSEVEGLLFVMRRIIVWADERGELNISPAQAVLVREVDYRMDVRRKRIDERERPNRLLENFILTFSLFPRVFASEFEIDYGNNGWEAFQKIVAARNSVTHPKSPQDTLLRADMPTNLSVAAAWFYSLVTGFLRSVDAQVLDRSMRAVATSPEARALLEKWSANQG